jgi:hypothetical protein
MPRKAPDQTMARRRSFMSLPESFLIVEQSYESLDNRNLLAMGDARTTQSIKRETNYLFGTLSEIAPPTAAGDRVPSRHPREFIPCQQRAFS